MKNILIIILVIYIFLFSKINTLSQLKSLKCDEEEIENCKKCGTGEFSDTCAECEDNYFPFLFNYLCLPCDHLYGDSGCLGKCYINNNLAVTCDEFGCKDGFYSINKKTCINCNSFNTANCVKCSNLPPAGKTPDETDERIFKCHECINDVEYRIDSFGKCRNCLLNHIFCTQCHYLENSLTSVCDKCFYDYYLRYGVCVKCRKKIINNGKCRYCTDIDTDYKNIYCSCDKYYTLSSPTICTRCPDHCEYCQYS